MSRAHLPILYLPGASGRGAVWGNIAQRLLRRRAAILCDYPGFGAAPSVSGIESLDDLTRHLLTTLPARCDVVALSMGAAVALRLALEDPTRIRRLVLVTAAGGVDVESLGGIDWRAAFRERKSSTPAWFLDDRVDLSAQLERVIAPTLLVFGDEDLIAPVAVGVYLRAKLPNANLEIVEGATHDLEVEQPDLLASLIEAHLRRGDREA